MMLAPLYTMMADEVPDHQKGVAGGLLTLASPIGSALAAVLVATGLGEDGRFALVCGFVAICVVPLLLVRPHPTDTTPRSEEHTSELQSLMRISYAVF